MRFALDDDAVALRDAAAEVLRAETGLLGGDPAAGRDAAWGKLCALGAMGTLVPEDRGGLGLNENALVPLLEQIGYRGLAGPAVETIAVAAPLLDSVPDTFVAVQASPGEPIAFAEQASHVVLLNELRLYERGELRLEPCAPVDRERPLARLVEARGGTRLAGDADLAWNRGVLGTAAVLTGLARRMLDMTVAYVRRREQFGVPVGSFQAIKHALADALVAVEFARPLVLAAGWAQAVRSQDAGVLTSAAKARTSDVARRVARTAIQCHGAMGYTTEYDLHMFAKRAWALAPAWGDAAAHRALIAESIGVTSG
jgi:alkylation response protein AidB-like acyl-CoA dehydrogenase